MKNRGRGNPFGAQGKVRDLKNVESAIRSKFKDYRTLLEKEGGSSIFTDFPSKRVQRMEAFIEQKIKEATANNDKATVQALRSYQVNVLLKSHEAKLDEQYTKNFYSWMMGRGDAADHEKTPWARQPHALELAEVRKVLEQILDALFATELYLIKLIYRTPQSLSEYAIYYKYILNYERWTAEDDFWIFLDFPALVEGANAFANPKTGMTNVVMPKEQSAPPMVGLNEMAEKGDEKIAYYKSRLGQSFTRSFLRTNRAKERLIELIREDIDMIGATNDEVTAKADAVLTLAAENPEYMTKITQLIEQREKATLIRAREEAELREKEEQAKRDAAEARRRKEKQRAQREREAREELERQKRLRAEKAKAKTEKEMVQPPKLKRPQRGKAKAVKAVRPPPTGAASWALNPETKWQTAPPPQPGPVEPPPPRSASPGAQPEDPMEIEPLPSAKKTRKQETTPPETEATQRIMQALEVEQQLSEQTAEIAGQRQKQKLKQLKGAPVEPSPAPLPGPGKRKGAGDGDLAKQQAKVQRLGETRSAAEMLAVNSPPGHSDQPPPKYVDGPENVHYQAARSDAENMTTAEVESQLARMNRLFKDNQVIEDYIKLHGEAGKLELANFAQMQLALEEVLLEREEAAKKLKKEQKRGRSPTRGKKGEVKKERSPARPKKGKEIKQEDIRKMKKAVSNLNQFLKWLEMKQAVNDI